MQYSLPGSADVIPLSDITDYLYKKAGPGSQFHTRNSVTVTRQI